MWDARNFHQHLYFGDTQNYTKDIPSNNAFHGEIPWKIPWVDITMGSEIHWINVWWIQTKYLYSIYLKWALGKQLPRSVATVITVIQHVFSFTVQISGLFIIFQNMSLIGEVHGPSFPMFHKSNCHHIWGLDKMADISQTFSNAFSWIKIAIQISLRFVPEGPINNISALVQIMAWRRPDDKPLSEPMIVSLLTHICVTRPQWFIFKPWTRLMLLIYSLYMDRFISCIRCQSRIMYGHKHAIQERYLWNCLLICIFHVTR